MKALPKLIAVETKLYYREPVGAFFSIIFPGVLIVVLGLAIPGFRQPADDIGGRRPVDVYFPVLMSLAIVTVTMVALLNVLALYRERGVLRRLSATPVSPTALILAQLVVNLAALILGVLLAYGAAVLVFDIGAPANIAGVLIGFTLGAAAMGMIALFIAAVVPSQKASVGWGSLISYPMMFFAGVWTPGPAMPDGVRRVADFTPLGAASQAMQAAWAGGWPRPLHLAVMAATVAAFGTAAAKLFRWQ
jgi:ABC-2 type transport system permease protein